MSENCNIVSRPCTPENKVIRDTMVSPRKLKTVCEIDCDIRMEIDRVLYKFSEYYVGGPILDSTLTHIVNQTYMTFEGNEIRQESSFYFKSKKQIVHRNKDFDYPKPDNQIIQNLFTALDGDDLNITKNFVNWYRTFNITERTDKNLYYRLHGGSVRAYSYSSTTYSFHLIIKMVRVGTKIDMNSKMTLIRNRRFDLRDIGISLLEFLTNNGKYKEILYKYDYLPDSSLENYIKFSVDSMIAEFRLANFFKAENTTQQSGIIKKKNNGIKREKVISLKACIRLYRTILLDGGVWDNFLSATIFLSLFTTILYYYVDNTFIYVSLILCASPFWIYFGGKFLEPTISDEIILRTALRDLDKDIDEYDKFLNRKWGHGINKEPSWKLVRKWKREHEDIFLNVIHELNMYFYQRRRNLSVNKVLDSLVFQGGISEVFGVPNKISSASDNFSVFFKDLGNLIPSIEIGLMNFNSTTLKANVILDKVDDFVDNKKNFIAKDALIEKIEEYIPDIKAELKQKTLVGFSLIFVIVCLINFKRKKKQD
jgi:hypothetical protein